MAVWSNKYDSDGEIFAMAEQLPWGNEQRSVYDPCSELGKRSTSYDQSLRGDSGISEV